MKVRIVVSFRLCCIPSSKMMSDIYQIYTENPRQLVNALGIKTENFITIIMIKKICGWLGYLNI